MTDTNTTNLGLLLMATGGDTNAWGGNLNSSVIQLLDQVLGSKLSLSVAGSSNVTLNSTQSPNLYFNFTGVLTGNISVIFPASAGRLFIVNNATTGAFTLTVTPSGGTGFLVTQGTQQLVQIDPATNTAQAPENTITPFEVTKASATTTDLGATGTNIVAISGTTTITSFGSTATINECLYFVRFTGILTLTNNATSLILPGAANITTAAGDCALFKYEGSGNWRCMFYQPASGFVSPSSPTFTGTVTAPSFAATTGIQLNAHPVFTQIIPQKFTSTGTYTPTSGMAYCIIEAVGGGGGGGGAKGTTATAGGGGGGGYTKGIFTAAQIGASQTVTINTGGTGGSTAGGNGVAGGSVTVGSLISVNGGSGGNGSTAGMQSGGGGGGVTTAGNLVSVHGSVAGFGVSATGFAFFGGGGGGSFYGAGGGPQAAGTTGNAGTDFGAGGSGSGDTTSTGFAGGAGSNGIVIITEYVSA